ncbi:GbsR/MarR family transcriptional regulator [Hamadaea tsunoensis]|uniref:GbsR/MarR family transcriptional regulator n=1 Tax=Hamadaea tsunoensis TaxID=53368 RepID=UPI0004203085|nr:helix-turn-helix domain-containing protein [Hamadaea tsunoensis]
MPGERLTLQDRRRIAAGLARRLGYAEIARELSRPTSTITREVQRNGGPRTYQADRAHHTAAARAQRQPAATPHAPIAGAAAFGRDPEAVRTFRAQLTEVSAQTGLGRVAAGILACLYTTDDGSLTAADLVAQLNVSPATISKAIGDLEQAQLTRREREPGARHDRYHVNGDVWYRSWIASAQQNIALAQFAAQGAAILGSATPAGARLTDTSDLLGHLGQTMLTAAEDWARRKEQGTASDEGR